MVLIDPETNRRPEETVEDYFVRICSDKTLYDLSFNDIADLMNAENGQSFGECKYRKEWAAYLKWHDYIQKSNVPDEALERHQLIEERVRLRDERTELNRLLRENARRDNFWDNLYDELTQKARCDFPPVCPVCDHGERTLLVCLSDIHYGLKIDSAFGSYSTSIAAERLANYMARIVDTAKANDCSRCKMVLLGDLINGNIHITGRVSNTENIIEQVKQIGDLLSHFVYDISRNFQSVEVSSVSGNHSRIDKKDDALCEERLDNLIPWYLRASLAHLDNVDFPDYDLYNHGSTIARVAIGHREYWFVHGDIDDFSQAGAYKLVSFLDSPAPYAIVYGHLHTVKYLDGSIKLLSSGSLCGSGDDFTVKKRLSGNPCQLMCVCSGSGIEQFIPVTLD